MKGKYKIGFDIRGLILFLGIMIPNCIWFAVPAPDDVLRAESVTWIVDAAGSVFQIMTVASLCFIKNKSCPALRFTPLIIAAVCCAALYYLGWILYYSAFTGPPVILALTVPPCAALLLYALDRRNYIAVLSGAAFTVCHLIYGIVNFIAR